METWNRALARLSGMAVEQARHFDRVAVPEAGRLTVVFRPEYDFAKLLCERPEQTARFEQALAAVTGRPVRVEFAVDAPAAGGAGQRGAAKPVSQQQRTVEASKHPLIKRAAELFGAMPTHVENIPTRSASEGNNP